MKAGSTLRVFYATTNQEARLMEPDKFSEWKWVPVKNFIEDPIYGEINPVVQKMNIDFLNKF